MCVIVISNTAPETLPGHVDDQRLVSICGQGVAAL